MKHPLARPLPLSTTYPRALLLLAALLCPEGLAAADRAPRDDAAEAPQYTSVRKLPDGVTLATLSTSAGRSTVFGSATCLRDDFPEAAALFAECFLHPTFPEEEFKKVKTLALGAIGRRANDPRQEAFELFYDSLPSGSPYHLSPKPDFQPIDLDRDNAIAKTVAHHKQTGKPTGMVLLGYPGVSVRQPKEYAAMVVLDAIISGYSYPGGWLHTELRGEGLVYYVHAFQITGPAPGYLAVMAQTQPEQVEEVMRRIRENLARRGSEGMIAEGVREFEAVRSPAFRRLRSCFPPEGGTTNRLTPDGPSRIERQEHEQQTSSDFCARGRAFGAGVSSVSNEHDRRWGGRLARRSGERLHHA